MGSEEEPLVCSCGLSELLVVAATLRRLLVNALSIVYCLRYGLAFLNVGRRISHQR